MCQSRSTGPQGPVIAAVGGGATTRIVAARSCLQLPATDTDDFRVPDWGHLPIDLEPRGA